MPTRWLRAKAEIEEEKQSRDSLPRSRRQRRTRVIGPAAEPEEPADLQVELAKSMRKIISGVVKRIDDSDEDIPASVDENLQNIQKLQMPETPEQTRGQLSIDDVLLSMSDKGKSITDAVLGEEEEDSPAGEKSEEIMTKRRAMSRSSRRRMPDMRKRRWQRRSRHRNPGSADGRNGRNLTEGVREAAQEELTDVQREALQYTSNPDKLLRNKRSLPTYMEEKEDRNGADDDDLGKTRRIASRDELAEAARKEILAEKTIRIPTEQITRRMSEMETEQDLQEDSDEEVLTGEAAEYDGVQELPEQDSYYEEELDENGGVPDYEEDEEYEESLVIPDHLRELFIGFTEVEGLEDQIANAIIQAESKGDDKTSRSGNILIFGPHRIRKDDACHEYRQSNCPG